MSSVNTNENCLNAQPKEAPKMNESDATLMQQEDSKDPITRQTLEPDSQTTDGQEEDSDSLLCPEKWQSTFREVLDHVDHKGDFAAGFQLDQVPLLHPKIVVEGSRLAFPLQEFQAQQLRSLASKAPYGKGTETVVDEAVRKAWQIDAEKVEFLDALVWDKCLGETVQRAGQALGLSCGQLGKVQANLYKMLLYEPGGHFRKHRDTEKEPGMFGTLVIQLPSKFQGGELALEHAGETKVFNFSAQSEDAVFATAFYADCEHELRKVTSGWRLCLVYNLVWNFEGNVDGAQLPTAAALTEQVRLLRKLESRWSHVCSTETRGYLLKHKYTPTNIRFQNLKGSDKEVVDLLRGVCDVSGNPLFIVSLMLIVKWETGSAEDDGYHRRGYGDYSDDDDDDGPHAMNELHDSSTEVNHWVGPDDTVLRDFRLQFLPEEQLLGDKDLDYIFEGEDPDDEDYEGYMGNSGPTLQYWYYKAAVVFWPRSQNLEVTCKAGFSFLTSSFLSACGSDAKALAEKVVECLEKKPRESYHSRVQMSDDVMLGLLQLNDEKLLVRALQATSRICSSSFARALSSVVTKVQTPEVKSAVLQLVEKSARSLSEVDKCIEFAEELRKSGNVTEFYAEARNVILNSSLANPNDLMKSANRQVVGKLAYESPPHFKLYVDAVLQDDTPSKLQTTLKTFLEYGDSKKNKDVQRLAKKRAEQLQEETSNGRPQFSWRQPKANFQGSQAAAVNQFLRGDEQSRTFYGFNGIRDARNWSNKYFSNYISVSSRCGYSATARTGGSGSKAYVHLTKTANAYQSSKKQFEADVAELNNLVEKFGSNELGCEKIDGSLSQKRSPEKGGASTKRARTDGGRDNPISLL